MEVIQVASVFYFFESFFFSRGQNWGHISPLLFSLICADLCNFFCRVLLECHVGLGRSPFSQQSNIFFHFFIRREITKTSKERKLGTYRLPRKHNIWSAEHRREIWPEWRMTKKEVEQNYFFSVPLECCEEFDLPRPSLIHWPWTNQASLWTSPFYLYAAWFNEVVVRAVAFLSATQETQGFKIFVLFHQRLS